MEPFVTKVEKITENIFAIDQEMVRSYVVLGKQKALCFDFGVVPVDFRKYLDGITDLPFIYVLSHSDPDHVANICVADKVYVSRNEIDLLEKYPRDMFITVSGGDVFDLGGVVLEVIDTPGHTPGSISLLWAEKRILFSGDTLSYGPVYMFGDARNLEVYKKSLLALLKMADDGVFTEIYPAHNVFPVTPETIVDLLTIVGKLEDGNAAGEDPGRSFPGFENVKLFRSGKCGILF